MMQSVIKLTVMYPNDDDCRFNFEYWTGSHFSLLHRELGDALKSVQAERGLSGAAEGSQAMWVAIAHLFFDSVEAFQASFGPRAATIMGDIPNYTNVMPTVQISEVLA